MPSSPPPVNDVAQSRLSESAYVQSHNLTRASSAIVNDSRIINDSTSSDAFVFDPLLVNSSRASIDEYLDSIFGISDKCKLAVEDGVGAKVETEVVGVADDITELSGSIFDVLSNREFFLRRLDLVRGESAQLDSFNFSRLTTVLVVRFLCNIVEYIC